MKTLRILIGSPGDVAEERKQNAQGARHYGGHPATAVQVILATTVVSLVTTPLVISLVMPWLGLGE
jgi:hypothetical protein